MDILPNNNINAVKDEDKVIYGTSGNDLINGGSGNDQLYGGDGNDILIGGTGDDYLSGDAGSDTYIISQGDGNDTIYNYKVSPSDYDVIQFTNINSTDVQAVTVDGNDLVIHYGDNNSVRLQYYFSGNDFRVQSYQFADKTLNNNQLMALNPITIQSDNKAYTFGNDGNRIIGANSNEINSGNGDDYVTTGSGNNVVDGGAGNDQINAGNGNDTLYGGAGNDSLNGGAGKDQLYGGDGNDTIVGGTGDDYLSGDAGSDTYVLSKGDGNDTIYNYNASADDHDVVRFTNINSTDIQAVTVDGNDLVIHYGDNDSVRLQYYFSGDNFRVKEYQFADKALNNDQLMALNPITIQSDNQAYYFGNGGNKINGANSDQIFSGAGDDTVTTGGGDNLVEAGDGDDKVYSSTGNDTVYGGAGNDSLSGGTGDNQLYGGDGNDTIVSGSGNDFMSGDAGSDTYVLSKGSGNDTIYNYNASADDHDVVQFNNIASTDITGITTDNGDLIIHYGDNDSVRLQYYFSGDDFRVKEYQFADKTLNNDQLMALRPIDIQSDNQTYYFGNGGNQINGANTDQIFSGAGDDTVKTGNGNNYVEAGDGNDKVYGGTGNDTIYGGTGNDLLNGGDGSDHLYGGDGNDTIVSGAGDDYLSGDAGSDTYIFSKGDGNDTVYNHVTSPDEHDVIQFSNIASTDVTSLTIDGQDLIIHYGDNDSVRLQYYFSDSDDFRVKEYQFADKALNNDELMGLKPINIETDGGTYHFGDKDNQIIGGNSEHIFTGSGNDTISGGNGNNYIETGDGDDQIYNGNGYGSDTVYAGTGNDTIVGGAGNDQLFGEDGNDVIVAGLGNDYIDGGTGDDVLVAGSGDNQLVGGDGSDTIIGGPGNNYVDAGNGDDKVYAGVGNDTIYGGTGDDLLSGGAGNDQVYGGFGNDTIIGGTGDDYLSGDSGSNTYVLSKGDGNDTIYNYSASPDDHSVVQFTNIASTDVNSITVDGNDLVIHYGDNDSVRLQYYFSGNDFRTQQYQFSDKTIDNNGLMALKPINIQSDNQTYYFGDDGNQIIGANSDRIFSGGGDDVVTTGEGDNFVDAGNGNDKVTASDGNDTIYGGAGNDLINGGAGNNQLYGGTGNDTIVGGSGDDFMSGDAGSDTYVLSKGNGNDTIYNYNVSPDDQDVIQFTNIASTDVTSVTAEGGDLIIHYGDNDSVRLQYYFSGDDFRVREYQFADKTLNNDQLMALRPVTIQSDNQTYYFGNNGNQINGADSDRIFSGTGDDIIRAGNGENFIDAGDGDDRIYAGTGNDTIYGGAGNDLVNGGAGNNQLYGGAGNDTIVGGSGDDFMSGDAGSDTYVLSKGSGNDTIYNYNTSTADQDVIQFNNIASTDVNSITVDGQDLVVHYGDNDSVRLQYYFSGDNFRVQDYQFSDKTLNNDQLMALKPIQIQSDNQTYYFGDGGNEIYGANADRIFSGSGNDTVTTGDGNNYVEAGNGNDQVYAGTGNDTIYAGTGNDLIKGGAGNDQLFGGDGNDTIIGGAGNDFMSGDAGSDTYVLSRGDGTDTIYNFRISPTDHDVVQFTGNITKNDLQFSQNGNDLNIHLAGGDDSFVIQDWFRGSSYHVNEFTFTDGSSLTDADINRLVRPQQDFYAAPEGASSVAHQLDQSLKVAVNK